MFAYLVWLSVRLFLFQSHYVIIAGTTKFCNVVLTLFNMFCITRPIEHLFLQGVVQIKGGCFIGGIERIS